MSFGVEGVDRYIVVYKKEHLPSEDELAARKNGDPWNKQTAEEYAEKRKQQKLLDQERQKQPLDEKKVSAPVTNYKDKYVHLIGQDAALEAAKKTETNKSYGYGRKICKQGGRGNSNGFLFQFPARINATCARSNKPWPISRQRRSSKSNIK